MGKYNRCQSRVEEHNFHGIMHKVFIFDLFHNNIKITHYKGRRKKCIVIIFAFVPFSYILKCVE